MLSEYAVPAIVVDIQSITALQTARLLASRGIQVIGIGSDPWEPFCRSRSYTKTIFTCTTDERLIQTLEALGPTLEGKAPLFLSADEAVLLVSKHRDRIAEWYHIALPADEIVRMLVDKMSFARFAEANGLPAPRTHCLDDSADPASVAAQLRYPAIIKPAVRASHWAAHTKAKALKVWTAEEFVEAYQRVRKWGGDVIAQEWIPGPESELISCNGYFDRSGMIRASFVARKIRQWPPETGRSSLGIAAPNDEVRDITVRTFQIAAFSGPAYLELKRDERDGRYWIIEPNVGRATGRSAIAEAGGVELLLTQYCDMLGLPLPQQRTQGSSNVKWIYLRWDLQASLVAMSAGRLTPREWWRSLQGKKVFAAWSREDPVPFLLDFWAPLGRRLRGSIDRFRRVLAFASRRARVSGPAGRSVANDNAR
jgi:D-aspartate ligase